MSFLTRPKVLIYLVLTLATGGLLARELGRELATPEERVRFSIDEALDDFNDHDGDWSGVLWKHFVFQDYDRQMIRQSARQLFWYEDPHAVLREDLLKIDVGSEDKAKVTFAVDVFTHSSTEEPWWEIRGTLRFVLHGDRWRVVRADIEPPTTWRYN